MFREVVLVWLLTVQLSVTSISYHYKICTVLCYRSDIFRQLNWIMSLLVKMGPTYVHRRNTSQEILWLFNH